MWAALEKTQKRLYPEATVLPMMLTGASDLSPLRSKGVQAYGIGPLMLEKDIKEGVGAHRIMNESWKSHSMILCGSCGMPCWRWRHRSKGLNIQWALEFWL